MAFMHCFSMLNVTGKCYQPAVLGTAEWACGLLQCTARYLTWWIKENFNQSIVQPKLKLDTATVKQAWLVPASVLCLLTH